MMYLGDYEEDDLLYFTWSSNNAAGAAVTSAGGTIKVYKDDNDDEVTAPTGITNVTDFDSITGVHHCTIDLSANVFYAVGGDYSVVLVGATIDSQTVNVSLAHFSIENRSANTVEPDNSAITAAITVIQNIVKSGGTGDLAAILAEVANGAIWDELVNDHLTAGTTGKKLHDLNNLER